MKKLLGIIVLGLLLSGNVYAANKSDEYQCYWTDGSGPTYYSVTNNHVIDRYMTSNSVENKITERTKDKIISSTDTKKITFYKRTNKFLTTYGGSDTYLASCTKLN
ncbi:hypothetical protein OAT04_05350 [Candidatus Pelagibacter sp.]|jgi:hypothetical protein|nr:hypothetical protein [Candidatus Pelagibacter sp.]